MVLLSTLLNKKSTEIPDKLLSYLAIAIAFFNLICSLFETSNFQHSTDSLMKTIGCTALGYPNLSSNVTV